MRKFMVAIPLLLFAGLSLLLFTALGKDPKNVPSALIGKAIPNINLSTLNGGDNLRRDDFIGHVSLLNVWATWCDTCRHEHEELLFLKQRGVTLFGLDYKDSPEQARRWLVNYGDPYQKVGVDGAGLSAIDWGVYGTPETFLIDKRGIIRYKHIGAMSHNDVINTLWPLIQHYRKET